ncbi:hypothetical protein PWEIH_01275 [Listeria weihenstephanensis FSL R9-0317]|uniref:Uncharacterized protein n=1 Tax=Listeria weihenstephanensis TaxID=1006155 RepID=A0A1S7FWB0_9LIST|nr:hypothetical protein [Listeria weihenstephanensis]AQY51731.1 hypothetical protein UE46_12255 [Listeria weihenstephanensis]EUJ41255.1 hypothetical protein PWEIH_01275 [Listeria weihenstephanensis FSL R9-0317]MBC1500563.1 hypothetical protein [Listeria weihenstephanensis]
MELTWSLYDLQKREMVKSFPTLEDISVSERISEQLKANRDPRWEMELFPFGLEITEDTINFNIILANFLDVQVQQVVFSFNVTVGGRSIGTAYFDAGKDDIGMMEPEVGIIQCFAFENPGFPIGVTDDYVFNATYRYVYKEAEYWRLSELEYIVDGKKMTLL